MIKDNTNKQTKNLKASKPLISLSLAINTEDKQSTFTYAHY